MLKSHGMQVESLPAALQEARISYQHFSTLAKLRWSSQQLAWAMHLFKDTTGHIRRANFEVRSLPRYLPGHRRWSE